MFRNLKFYNINLSVCLFHQTANLQSITVKKQGTILKKMLFPVTKRKWFETNPNAMPAVKSLPRSTKEPSKRALKRKAVLNKLFMKHITDFLTTGSISMDVLGRGLEITKVDVAPDFQTVNVYWLTKGEELEGELEKVLSNRIAGVLRHELSQLRVMGVVPMIVFVKDREQADLVELERRLKIADFGEDFTPTKLGHNIISDFTLETKLDNQILEKIKSLENAENGNDLDEDIPQMTHTVYGLDHAKFYRRMVAARKKSIDAWSNVSNNDPKTETFRTEQTIDSGENVEDDRKNIRDFLQKRQFDEEKRRKAMMSKKPELEIALEEVKSKVEQNEEHYSDTEFEDYFYDEYLDNEEFRK